MRVGGWHGWAQSVADGLKLIQKEDIYLEGADRPLHKMAPYVSFMPALVLFLALPFSAAWIARDLDVGLIFILAMIGVGVLGVLLAGWASNNKWSMFGAMREACLTISYEIPLGFALLVPILTVGTLRLKDIGEIQAGGFHTWLAFANPFTLAAAVIFFVATLASCKRAPFDLPEAESELVAGYMTEYSGFRWALFMFAEYAEMFAVSALAAVLFFGAWNSPLRAQWGESWADGALWQRALHGVLFGGPLWLVVKGFFLVYVQIWLRWTLPRIRIDQVMHACVHVMLPTAMLVLLGGALWQLLVPARSWLAIAGNVVCTAVAAAALAGFVGIAAYGYVYRRRLVGTQAVEHLPGA
jgi:NADH-quinone oxidoreductase subunit H